MYVISNKAYLLGHFSWKGPNQVILISLIDWNPRGFYKSVQMEFVIQTFFKNWDHPYVFKIPKLKLGIFRVFLVRASAWFNKLSCMSASLFQLASYSPLTHHLITTYSPLNHKLLTNYSPLTPRSSSIQGRLTSKVIFHPRPSSI